MEQWWQEGKPPESAPSHPQRTSALYSRAEQPFEGLHYNTFQYYDTDTGRFLHLDSIRLTGG